MNSQKSLSAFHPAVAAWFSATFPAPTPAQVAAWPAIRSGRHTLVAAPTGSGKTLTAFLSAIDMLVREGVEEGGLRDRTTILYVSPLKALSNDIRINLEAPLAGIRDELRARGLPDLEIRTAVRTGDTPSSDRERMKRRPPHILVTTPESLYVLLGSESGRAMLRDVREVIVDEIHAVAASKRGSHLAVSLERLESIAQRRITRIGLSATQKPIEKVAAFLTGSEREDCAIVDIGHARQRDLALEVPPVPLEAVMSNDMWELVYNRLGNLIEQHRTTLVFVNTRRMAERVSRHLSERLGKEAVTAHHGSLSREQRLDAEQRLKRGELRALVATASLELGIDIGDVDLVCQIASPRSIAAFLQRAGRAGHAVGGTPKARLFPTSRDDLVECAALLDCVRRGELDTLIMPNEPLDVLAQQIVAEIACQEWDEDALYDLFRRAYPFRALKRDTFDETVRMLSEGFTTRVGPRGSYIHRDAVNRRLRERRGARLTAVTSGGTIPDTGDYNVLLEPQATIVGTVNEDFAVESLAGDVFQLGNRSYRIMRVEAGRLRVEDAQGAPPNIPFWLGEAPGRTDELSIGVSRLRSDVSAAFDDGGRDAAFRWLVDELRVPKAAAEQIVDYLFRARAALGALPTRDTLVMERFFDESGGTQLIIHTPYGSRINRAWGLALRKRFCRKFNFELQAAATEDAIVLSLSTSHSFPLDEVARYLHSNSAEHVLIQALLDAPLFGVRWRWNATTALALPRFTGGRKVAPQLQRMKSEDLLATVFPDQVACAENLVGEREVPDHPLVKQTLEDCLHEAMDSEGLLDILRGLETGRIAMVARDLAAPSPLAAEVLSAAPYAFLDDAPLEERRTQAVQSRRWNEAESPDDLGRLDAEAIDAVRVEAWPEARSADEMHEALVQLGGITESEARDNAGWATLLAALAKDARATRLVRHGHTLWVAAERLPAWRALLPDASMHPAIAAPAGYAAQPWTAEAALVDIVRGRLGGLGPVPAALLADALGVRPGDVDVALAALESEGFVMRGAFSPGATEPEWCERHLLARIHRYTIGRLRREIEPVAPRDFLRFLLDWQHVTRATQVAGPDALAGIIGQLEGFEAAAGAWESELLPSRVGDYGIGWLDDLCRAGRVVWSRLRLGTGTGGPVRSTPIVLLPRRQLPVWSAAAPPAPGDVTLSSRAQAVDEALRDEGALFFDELASITRLLRTELEDALGELVAAGRVTADSFAGLRALLLPSSKRNASRHRRTRRHMMSGIEDAGRWSLARRPSEQRNDADGLEHIARTLLRRYGVVSWRILEREAAWLPSWRELRRVYHRLEARGEIRGGRFVDGLVGEQFALPEALAALRQIRHREHDGEIVCIAGTDPLNLVGSIVAGMAKVPATLGNRIAIRDGVPLAAMVAGKFVSLTPLEGDDEREARGALQRKADMRSFASL
ncbi:ATP-dependent helicase Lhr and Lhr-like helicase [Luteibacter sp. UNCMF331Sha3.1]|uniref:DEAD/DEAH box helicase n=1 Tax=Luteibacter sp. UNCMF331Sha3.1 TaxID=1502760 RepID=UPI0008ACED05|nr:DEAD/DEAH box helicase [Luteibacter sp. UNCMF331Sha3.1]SEM58067.1 ATP-dependent helicase Lhr and Lhr-like helicase [Luteibacter sp. UNCMF331Sha3.1]